jgi:hypothetical protein
MTQIYADGFLDLEARRAASKRLDAITATMLDTIQKLSASICVICG